ncbi:hypothetical protein CHUAL_010726 [Chamberlinius hualienensis]
MAHISLVVFIFLLATCFLKSNAYTALTPDDETDACVDDDGVIRQIGETWSYSGERCENVTCVQIDSQLYQSIIGCGKIEVSNDCVEVRNTTMPYPHCCPTPQC